MNSEMSGSVMLCEQCGASDICCQISEIHNLLQVVNVSAPLSLQTPRMTSMPPTLPSPTSRGLWWCDEPILHTVLKSDMSRKHNDSFFVPRFFKKETS